GPGRAAPGRPAPPPRPPGGPGAGAGAAGLAQPGAPEPAVPLLGRGQLAVDLGLLGARRGRGQQPVERRAVDLVLQVRPVAGDVGTRRRRARWLRRHRRTEAARPAGAAAPAPGRARPGRPATRPARPTTRTT